MSLVSRAATSLSSVARFIETISTTLGLIAGAWVVVMTGALGYEVVARRIFNRPTIWAMDFSEIAMVVMVYLGVAYTTKIGGHVSMDAVYVRLAPKNQTRVRIFVDLSMLGFAVVALWLGWKDAADFLHRWPLTQAAYLPIAPAVILIPFGVALMLLQVLVLLGRDISGLFSKNQQVSSIGS